MKKNYIIDFFKNLIKVLIVVIFFYFGLIILDCFVEIIREWFFAEREKIVDNFNSSQKKKIKNLSEKLKK
jgi:amino acid permease